MGGAKRREEILKIIMENENKISGTKLAEMFEVSRQVIVQDIALLRAEGYDIISTNRGYLCKEKKHSRIVYVYHEDAQLQEELNLIVDNGAKVEDVFVRHGVYGELHANLSIDSRKKVAEFMNGIEKGISSPLNKITSGYHYHTLTAETEEILDAVEQELKERGFLAEEP